jgi:hypothetical protein
MNFHIVITTKFYRECIDHLTYGASQSNWLCNVDPDDTVFLSQFSYKSQDLLGPFRVVKGLINQLFIPNKNPRSVDSISI